MPDLPILMLPAPGEPVDRKKKFAGPGKFHRPERERQAERLAPRIEELNRVFERTRLRADARGIVPEEVLVFETIGTVEGFLRGVKKIQGMEWLAEVEEDEIPPDDDFFAIDDKNRRLEKKLSGRLFLIFTSQAAMRSMLSLWSAWQRGSELPHGSRTWRRLFEQLHDIRRWDVPDRLLETGILDDWAERVAHGQEVIPCEIELWFRHSPRQRQETRDRVAGLVKNLEGRITNEVLIEEISYHALLAHLPIGAIRNLLANVERDAELVQSEQIQFFRASGQMTAVLEEDERRQDDFAAVEASPTTGEPVVALLDGLPLQAHARLTGRLIVDDPDGFEEGYSARDRRHGTAMASLILHGDLAARENPLGRPIYVRPILRPDSRDWRSPRRETVPEDTLVVDLLHRAVRRMHHGDGLEPAVAPEVAVVNLSIGIHDRLFEGFLSPLARLLDWLSWQYKVLFVVSAGNHSHSIDLPNPRGILETIEAPDLQSQVIRAVAQDTRHRRLLSPAEGLNVLTVGAVNHDASVGDPPPGWVDPFVDANLPSPINAQGMGYRRTIKPELLAPGGRIVLQEYLGSVDQMSLNMYCGTLPPGQAVAAPGRLGERNATWCTRGTSNATALISRGAALLSDVLEDLRNEPGGAIIDSVPRSIWLKALLVHGADWSSAGLTLVGILRTPENNRKFKEYLTRLLGYGAIDLERLRECTAYRVTALGGGFLKANQSHIHRFPLPPSLSGKRGLRRLIITLAWLTPVNPHHQSWRRADLWFAPPGRPLHVERKQADWRAVQRGTLQHEILEGEKAAVFVDGTDLEIQVSCRGDAGALEEEVPYSLVTTLEVAEEIGVPIYDEVRVRIQTRVPVVTSSGPALP